MHTIQSTNGVKIAYQRSGAGPPLVLVHGGTADHTRWAPILPALEEHFTVCAMDRRGRGASADAQSYAIEREFEDVAALVDSVSGGGQVDVVAHSFGAVCALEAALFTSNIRKLVLYEPAPPGFKEAPAIAALPPFDAGRFGRLATPTLLLLGGESRVAYREAIEQLHSMLPNSQIAVMPGQQHIAMNTAPEVFVGEVLGFLLQ